MRLVNLHFAVGLFLIPAAFAQQQRNFISCPIVRDTKTVPCFLAEYEGETYFLAIQQDIAAEVYPPQLLHEVLVEGTVVPGPRVCGGIPLKPVKLSVLPEVNRACNVILPAEPGIEAPPAKRGAGPSTRPLQLASATRNLEEVTGPFALREWKILFDYDSSFLFARDARSVTLAADFAVAAKAKTVEVTAYRGATLLSNGKTITEQESIATERAKNVADMLVGLGVPAAIVTFHAVSEVAPANGIDDASRRLVSLRVIP